MSALYAFMHHTYVCFTVSSCLSSDFSWKHENQWILPCCFRPQWSILHTNSKLITIDRVSLIPDPLRPISVQRDMHSVISHSIVSVTSHWHGGQKSTTFLTCSSTLSLPTQLTHSLHSQPRSATLPVSSNILIAWECLLHLLFTLFLTFSDAGVCARACVCAAQV